MQSQTVHTVLEQIAELEDPRIRSVNEKHGDDHGVNLTKLRALANSVKKVPNLGDDLWPLDNTAAQLVAILILKPRALNEDRLDAMLREARSPKVRDWFTNYLAKKSPHREAIRLRWVKDSNPVVAAAGWELTAFAVTKSTPTLNLDALLDEIEAHMKDAAEPLQWAMNHTLAEIGIADEERRPRALEIGERLGVLRDYPTSPGCTSPFAPIWITEIVARRSSQENIEKAR